jgi:hypothetical protein
MNSGTSEFSMYSKSQKTGLTFDEVTDGGTTVNGGDDDDIDKASYAGGTNITKNIKDDPIIVGLNTIFSDLYEEIVDHGQERLNYHKRTHKKL